jgi:CYTH domain-containing protein
MSALPPKYALPEVERRWLVSPSALPELSSHPCRIVEDKYLAGGHLRVRSVTEPSGIKLFKLSKKYAPVSPGQTPVVSVYLSEQEASVLWSLAGRYARKHRYALSQGALELYLSPGHPFAVFEVEFTTTSESAAYVPPSFVGEEVTGNAAYSGFALAAA